MHLLTVITTVRKRNLEINLFKFSIFYSIFSKLGHASALLQDKAIYVGCAVASYEVYEDRKTKYKMLLACNYAHTNSKGIQVYSEKIFFLIIFYYK